MHFKLFFSVLVFGYATAAILGGKVINVSNDGSNILVSSQNGVKVNIFKNRLGGLSGLEEIDVTVAGPTVGTKTVRINDPQGARIVAAILAQNQGVVDDLTFENILNRIERRVQTGQVNPKFAHVLRLLTGDEQIQLAAGNIFGQQFNQGVFNTNNKVEKETIVEDILDKELKIESLSETQQQAEIVKDILKQEVAQKQNQINKENVFGVNSVVGQVNKQAQVQDILNKEAKIEALTETQVKAEAAKQALKQHVAQEQTQLLGTPFGQQNILGQLTAGRQGVSQKVWNTLALDKQTQIEKEALVKDILKKEAKIQAIKHVQQQAEVAKEILKREIVQQHEQLQSTFGYGNTQSQLTNQILAQNVMKKQAKIEALTEAQQKAEVKKQILEQEIAQNEIKLTGQVSPKGLRSLVGLRNAQQKWTNGIFGQQSWRQQAEIEKEALVESILKKQAKIQALTEVQQEIEIVKDVLKRETLQEEVQATNDARFQNQWGFQTQNVNEALLENVLQKEAKIEALTEAQQKAEATKHILKQQVAQEQQKLRQVGFATIQGQSFTGLNSLGGFEQVPLVYQHPSVWNQVSFRTQTPFTLGGQFNTQRGLTGLFQQTSNPWAQQQVGKQLLKNQLERQIQFETEREIEQEIQQQRIQRQLQAQQLQGQFVY